MEIKKLEVTDKTLDGFFELISNQFMHGGDKYALQGDKEFTDLVCQVSAGHTGSDWIIQTMVKYLGRFKNLQREKDFLKIACYCYIIYLKTGCQFEEENVSGKVYNTGLDTKKDNYELFEKKLRSTIHLTFSDDRLNSIWDMTCEFQPGLSGVDYILQSMFFSLNEFLLNRNESELLHVASLCYAGWVKMGFADKSSHDEDVKKEG